MKYLTLIRAIALLHQHQRPRKSTQVDGRQVVYIEATADDVRLANRLARRVLGRSLDELAPGARRLLGLLEGLVAELAGQQGAARERVQFARRELREHLSLGDTQLKVHLSRLVSMELMHVQRGAHGAYRYALAYRADEVANSDAHGLLPGLIDPDQQPEPVDRSGSGADRSGTGRPPVAPRSAPDPDAENGGTASSDATAAPTAAESVDPGGEERFPASSAAPVAVTAAARVAG